MVEIGLKGGKIFSAEKADQISLRKISKDGDNIGYVFDRPHLWKGFCEKESYFLIVHEKGCSWGNSKKDILIPFSEIAYIKD